MRCGRRMRDQTLGIPEIVRDPDQLQRVRHFEGGSFSALEFKCNQRGAARHLPLDTIRLRVIRTSTIDHSGKFCPLGKKICKCGGTARRSLDPQR